MASLMTYEEIERYLFSLRKGGKKYGIERMRLLDAKIGSPHTNFPIIHVAGTNGKSSTCTMLEKIYRKAGYKTGVMISPHLVDLSERVKVDGMPIPKKRLIQYVYQLKQVSEELGSRSKEDEPSFFEYLTAIGFLYFRDENIEIGIVETGLGGMFDSTNIVLPEVAVITSISFDHTKILGSTLESIAMAKAGIIKENVPTVIGCLPEEAESVIRDIAKEKKSQVISVPEAYGKNIACYPLTALKGSYQRVNAATALLVCNILSLRFPVKEKVALTVLNSISFSGRWQVIKLPKGNNLILEAAHNEEGARAIEDNLKEWSEKAVRPLVIVYASSKEEGVALMLSLLSKYTQQFIFTVLQVAPTLSFEAYERFLPSYYKGKSQFVPIEDLFSKTSPSSIFFNAQNDYLVIGSLYLVGECLKFQDE